MSIRKDLEARFGIAFGDLMQRFADIDVDRKATAALLNVPYPALMKLLERHGDPFPAHAVVVRYRQETGESLTAGITRLASLGHNEFSAARELGVSESSIRRCVTSRNLDITFRRRVRQGWREHRATGQARRTSPTWQTYEINGVRGSLRELTERFASVPLGTVRNRIHRLNWSVQAAVLTPRIDIENRDANLVRMQRGYENAIKMQTGKKRQR